MVVPIIFPDEKVPVPVPSAPELGPDQSNGLEPDGVLFRLGHSSAGQQVTVRGSLLTDGYLAQFMRRRNYWMVNGQFILKMVEKEGFDMLICHLEGKPLLFLSIREALVALHTSLHTECPTLCKLAVEYVDENLCQEVLLEVMRIVVQLNNNVIFHVKWDSSFFLDPGVEHRLRIKSLLFALLHNCTNISSDCVHKILQSKEFLQLPLEDAKNILLYLDLNIQDELIIFNVIQHWCNVYMANEPPNKRREHLGEPYIRLVRYALLTEEEFIEGPVKSQLLLPYEVQAILKCIRNKKSVPQEERLAWMRNINKKRMRSKLEDFDLSVRTKGGCSHLCLDMGNCPTLTGNFVQPKKEKDPPKILLGLLRCWQVIFD